MDEVPVSYDCSIKYTFDFQGTKEISIKKTSVQKKRFKVLTAILSNGLKLGKKFPYNF